jgi:hypothetical protein
MDPTLLVRQNVHAPVRDLGDGAVVEFAVDVKARKQAEEAEWRLSAIVESPDDAIISKNSTASSQAGTKAPNAYSGTRRKRRSANPSPC